MKNKRIKDLHSNLHRSPVAHACLTFSMLLAASAAQAAAGFGDTNDANGAPIRAQTYYAHSPTGVRAAIPPEAVGIMGSTYAGDTGKALRKFVDQLPQVGKPGTLSDGTTSKYIPVAAPGKWRNPAGQLTGDDYYEIAVVEYTEKMHSDLKNPTRIRGYVQIDAEASNGRPAMAGSKAVALFYPSGSPIMIPATDANGKLLVPAASVQAKAYDNPHYLGPAIMANRGTATRLKFHNLLPVGRYNASTGRNGDLFLPVDETLAGAGVGPDGVTRYTQNRAEVHLHGGDNPWISDGTPHQWIAPAGERALLSDEMSKAGSPLPVDTFLRGPGAINVPDMNDPGEGAMTYYFPNKQSARLEWYHDHSYGLTRLNVYAGMVAPYVLSDAGQDTLLKQVTGFPSDTIHLVIQDKTFVPEDIKLQDGRWNAKVDTAGNHPLTGKPLWGEADDMWYPHVYEVNQDPSNGLDGTNPVGRWDWGPYFWPVFPSMYNLPTGGVDDVTLTPEAWMDTPLVNGVAYPTVTVQPRAQRFKILNGSNDRFWNLSFFLADSAISEIKVPAGQGGSGYLATDPVTISSSTGSGAKAELMVDAAGTVTAIRVTNAGTGYSSVPGVTYPTVSISSSTGSGATPQVVVADSTEVKMVPAVPAEASGLASCATDANGVDIVYPEATTACWPSTWPTDGRDGGVPDPRTNGPKIYQIGNEAGLLPQVAEITPQPMQYEYNRRSITVLNTFVTGLLMGNAERADIVVDFTPYAGKTLIMYSDAPAPVPAFDPRNDHWTGKPDETAVGSVETPKAGFGPNTRTVMQIKVEDTAAAFITILQAAQAQLATAQSNLTSATTIAGADAADALAKQAVLTTANATAVTANATEASALNALLAALQTGSGVGAAATAYATAVLASDSADAAAALALSQYTVAQAKADASAQVLVTATAAVDLASAAVATASAAVPVFTPLDVTSLKTKLPVVYGDPVVGQELPIVAQSTYNDAFGKTWSDAPQTDGTKAFATIFTGSLQEPSFRFTPGTPNGAFDKVSLQTPGMGYLTPPVPVIDAPAAGGVQATAATTLRVGQVNVTNPGAAFKFTPTITFTNLGTGSGASAVARMQVSRVRIGAGGTGYSSATPPEVTFSAPDSRVPNWVQATGTATVSAGGAVTGITITNAGYGYSSAPLVAIAAPLTGTRATASSELNIKAIDLVSNDPNHPEFAGGGGYDNMGNLTVNITAPTGTGAVAATATVTGAVSDITLVNAGRGYTSVPNITIAAPVGGTAATAVATAGGASILVKNKAIQELFDPTYGRMNATLGIEIPFTSAMTQTTIPLGYVDPVTEEFADGETQIWKITHNGVDAHPVHFHLLNVQVINRVGWDGTIKPPHANEYGWKETLIMNPLEDILVAVRAKKPVLPGFGLPFSQRLRDPSQPAGVPMGFTQINPATGTPAVVVNQIDNFGWEYVWHCHILGHEENDFMRPVKFNANEVVPAMPSNLVASGTTFSWTDNASTEYKYVVYTVNTSTGALTNKQTLPANTTSATVVATTATTTLALAAVGANGTVANLLTAPAALAAPTITASSLGAGSNNGAFFSYKDNSNGERSFVPQYSSNGGLTWTSLQTRNVNNAASAGTGTVYNTNTFRVATGTTYSFRVIAKGAPIVVEGVDLTSTSTSAITTVVH